jgi:hypothetical protein
MTGQLEQLADQMIEDVVAEPTIPPQVDEDAIAEVAALKILTEQLGQLADQVTEDVIAEPTIPQHSTAGQTERTDDAPALVQQEQEPQVVNEHEEQSNPSKAANDDFDDLMLIVEELSDFPVKDLDIMWNQLSENSQHRTAEQWERSYTDQILPTHKAKQLIALMKKRKLDRLMPGTAKRATASSKELDQPTGTAVSTVVRQDTRDRCVPSQVAHVTQGQIGTQINATPKTDDNGHQSCINGILRFKDCKTVNIACNEPESNGTLVLRKVITGEMIFEGCEDVNILRSQDLVPSSAKVQHRSRKDTQHPAQPACVNAQPQVPQEQPGQDPPQVAHQAPPVMQHVGAEAHPAAQPYGQSRPPQPPTQAQSYGPPPPPPQTCGQDRPQPYGRPGPSMQLPPLTHAYGAPQMHYTYDPLRPQANQGGSIQAQRHAAQHQPQVHPDNGLGPLLQRFARPARQQFQEIMPAIQPQTATNGPAAAPFRNPPRPRDAIVRPGRDGRRQAMREPDAYDEEGDSVYFDEDEDDVDGEELGTDEEYM